MYKQLVLKKIQLIKFIVMLCFILDIGAWYIVPIETKLTGVYNKKFITFVALGLSIYCLNYSINLRKNISNYIKGFSVYTILGLSVLTLYSMYEYPMQGLSGTFAMSYYFLGFLLVYPILYIMFYYNSLDEFMESINLIATFLIFVVLIQSVLYQLSGKIILTGLFSDNDLLMRNGRIRISIKPLGNIMLLYNFNLLCNKKARMINYIYFIVALYELFFVQMTRMYIVAILGSMIVIYLVTAKKTDRIFRNIIIMIAFIYIFFVSNILDVFLESFGKNSDLAASTNVRIEAINYFMKFVKNNPLFGMGFVHSTYYHNILYGNQGLYYLSDVGAIGLIAQGGIVMLISYIMFVFRTIYILVKTKNCNDLCSKGLLSGLLCFVLLTTPSLIMWNRTTMLYIALIMAIFEFKYCNLKDNI